ncbi:MAG: hypothetical protein IPI02_11005 [Sterolibacteriaceae bacterium]|nr:hypothetical protein [Sterolibacteriaceae bacterium]
MKHDRAVRGLTGSGVGASVGAGRTRVQGDVADADLQQRLRTQAHLPAEQHGFVVAWELRDRLATEQDWLPKSNRK